MTASIVQICNIALSRIGISERINSLGEPGAPAEQCDLFYELCRDQVLSDFDWPFATGFAALAQMATNPDPEFECCYTLPTDCLTVRRVLTPEFNTMNWPGTFYVPQQAPIKHRVIAGSSSRLLSVNIENAQIEYTKRIEAPGMFSAQFVSALAWKLAESIAPSISRVAGISQACAQAYYNEITRAKTVALNEQDIQQRVESSYITGRE